MIISVSIYETRDYFLSSLTTTKS
uniref:Uncharacterized protein n=1 Tax=Rhizophora mucronata TaxID=61149 RepID=A0A2P2IIS1_RHIMU